MNRGLALIALGVGGAVLNYLGAFGTASPVVVVVGFALILIGLTLCLISLRRGRA